MGYMELLILVIPSIVIFLTVYFLFKKFFEGQLRMKMMDVTQDKKSETITLKIQAYERLLLFCERIQIPTLLLRATKSDSSAKAAASTMVLMIQQEYEHNVTQQLYVSDKLWEIIQLAKNQMIEIVSQVVASIPENASVDELRGALMDYYNKEDRTPIETAKLAIKREAGLLL
jgi:hypothetical protein